MFLVGKSLIIQEKIVGGLSYSIFNQRYRYRIIETNENFFTSKTSSCIDVSFMLKIIPVYWVSSYSSSIQETTKKEKSFETFWIFKCFEKHTNGRRKSFS